VQSFRFRLSDAERIDFRRGDSDSSGDIEAADAIFLLSFLFSGGEAPHCLDAADSNDDGRISIADAAALLRSLFAGAGPLPAPGATCGEDGTADGLLCEQHIPCSG
jgi:hypothetical protein